MSPKARGGAGEVLLGALRFGGAPRTPEFLHDFFREPPSWQILPAWRPGFRQGSDHPAISAWAPAGMGGAGLGVPGTWKRDLRRRLWFGGISRSVALEKAFSSGTSLLNLGGTSPPKFGGLSSSCGGWCGRTHRPRGSLEGSGWDSPPPPFPTHPTFCLKQAVPRTEPERSALSAEGGSPARGQKGGPSPPPVRSWGGRGRGSWGKRGLCLPDSPVETAGVGGRARSAVGRLLSPPRASPCSHHRPPSWPSGAAGLERGDAVKLQGHSPLPPGTQASKTVPAVFPGISSWGWGAQRTWGFCLTWASPRTPGLT